MDQDEVDILNEDIPELDPAPTNISFTQVFKAYHPDIDCINCISFYHDSFPLSVACPHPNLFAVCGGRLTLVMNIDLADG